MLFQTKQLLYDLTPINLRTIEHQEWLQSFTIQLNKLKNDTMIPAYNALIFDTTHTGQVLSMEHYLNTIFSLDYPVPTVPTFSIWFGDGSYLPEFYIFNLGTDANSDLNNYGSVDPVDPTDGQAYIFDDDEFPTADDLLYLYDITEYDVSDYDFTVNIPSTIADATLISQVENILLKYKKVGKRYIILTY